MENQYHPVPALSLPFESFQYDTRVNLFSIPEHRHNFLELLFISEGSGRFVMDQQPFSVHAGDFAVIPPMTPHEITPDDGSFLVCQAVRTDPDSVGFFLSYVNGLRSVLPDARRKGMPFVFSAEEAGRWSLADRFADCVTEYQQKQMAYDLKIHGNISLILCAVLRMWLSRGFIPQCHAEEPEPMDTITSYIQQHIREPLKVEDLAERCRMSYPWFAKKFRERYGLSCKEYIRQVRVCQVEHYLIFTDCDLHYISRETGYADCSHMIKEFRSLWHTTPRQFRQTHRRHSNPES